MLALETFLEPTGGNADEEMLALEAFLEPTGGDANEEMPALEAFLEATGGDADDEMPALVAFLEPTAVDADEEMPALVADEQPNIKVTAKELDDEDEGAQPPIFASWAEEMDWMEQKQRSLELDVVDRRPVPTQDQAEVAPAQDAAALRRDDRSRRATPEGEESIVLPPLWRKGWRDRDPLWITSRRRNAADVVWTGSSSSEHGNGRDHHFATPSKVGGECKEPYGSSEIEVLVDKFSINRVSRYV